MLHRLLLPAALLILAGCTPAPPGPAAPVESPASADRLNETDKAALRSIHHELLIPGSEVLYSAEDAPPAVPAAWTVVAAGADKVMEAANRLAASPPALAGADWPQLARQLGQAAAVSRTASAAANADQLKLADETLAAVCTACHQTYVSN
jgi:hypothetical protein